jgi:hypothetical protein
MNLRVSSWQDVSQNIFALVPDLLPQEKIITLVKNRKRYFIAGVLIRTKITS